MYYIVYGFLYLVSLLPLRVLYFFSDVAYVIIYHIIRYRRDLVMRNMQLAFPEKSHEEIVAVTKKFYRNFTDNFIETIKMLSVDDNFLLRHFTGNWEVINEAHKSGKNLHILLGHNFNWEWGNYSIGMGVDYTLLVVYMPIANKWFNRLFLHLRTRGKTRMLSAHNMRKELMPYRNMQYALGLAADQNSPHPHQAYWLNFFGRPAPFVTGPEKGARHGNYTVVFCYIEKLRRGYYNMVISLAEENPAELPVGALTVKFVRYLENVIRKQPEMWLWTHNRWKHLWKEEYAKRWIDPQPPAIS